MLEQYTPDTYIDRFPFLSERSKKNVERLTAVFDAINKKLPMTSQFLTERKELLIHFTSI